MQSLVRALATVGGLGDLPIAPGTWGSAAGLLLGWLATRMVSRPVLLGVLVVTFVVFALIATAAEAQLGRHDPPSVVLDEAWAMASIVAACPPAAGSWGWLLLAFLLFRLFDVVKPPPLKRLEALPRGWGIMADDLGAAVYTILILQLVTPH